MVRISFLAANGEAMVPEETFNVDDTVSVVLNYAATHLNCSVRRVILLNGCERISNKAFHSLDEIGLSLDVVLNIVIVPDYSKYIKNYGPDLGGGRGNGKDGGHPDLFDKHLDKQQAFINMGRVQFPPQVRHININMMPFIIGDESSIPEEYSHYWPLIEKCHGEFNSRAEHGNVGYLTIQEGEVPAGESQRRPGLHIEAPCLVMTSKSRGLLSSHWGKGRIEFHDLMGGIYMASTVANSCKVWNAQIQNCADAVGNLGDIEHLREWLGEGYSLGENQMVWLTDTTPHESLPVKSGCYRRYFRFVTSGVSVWYREHSTANRLGIEPDQRWTKIISSNKFSMDKPCLHCRPEWSGWTCHHCRTTWDFTDCD